MTAELIDQAMPQHPFAGQTVTIVSGTFAGKMCDVENWALAIQPLSFWGFSAAYRNEFAARRSIDNLPTDGFLSLVYVRFDGAGHLLHNSELPQSVAAE